MMISRFAYTVLAISIWCLAAEGQTPRSQSVLRFAETVWDFGLIKEQDGPVSHVFEFTNAGTKPALVVDVSVSCGCTTPDFSRAPVKPGARGAVKITFDPTGRPGAFSKDVIVYSGNRRDADVLRIKGEVKPRPKSPAEEYPFLVAGGLRFKESLLTFRYVPQGTRAEARIGYENFSDRDMRVELRAAEGGSGALRTGAPQVLKAGSAGELTIAYDLTDCENCYGMFSDRIRIMVDGKESPLPLSTTAIGIDDFSSTDRSKAPAATFDTGFHNFGDVEAGVRPAAKRFRLTNSGRGPLHVRSVQTKKGVSAALAAGTVLEPGQSVEFEAVLDPSHYDVGRIFESIVVITDDPQRPMRDLRLTAVRRK